MGKSIALIGFVVGSMLLCSAQAFQPAPKLYRAKPEDVLPHIYDRDFEKMLGLLKQAEFNWIWVTWSSGWSFKDEDENRENLKKAIARCHENGIHVSAYLSASNMFRKSAYRDDPETKKYGLWMHGIPMF